MSISYCIDYHSFVIYFEIRACNTSRFVLLSQDSFSYLGSFVVSDKFYVYFISVKNAIEIW